MIVRGVNVFPTQIEELILRTPALSPHFQCVLDRRGRLDTLTVHVERRAGAAAVRGTSGPAATLVGAGQDTIGVSVAVDG